MENRNETALSTSPAATDDPVPPVTPSITLYQKLAAAMISSMEATAAEVPGYGDDLSDAGKVRKVLPREVIAMAVFAVEGSEELTSVDLLNNAETRDTLQFSEAFRPAVTHILGIARRLTLMMDVREAKAGRAALDIYGVMRRLVRNPDNTHLVVHVEKIRAELRRLRIGRIPKAPKPVTAANAAEGDDPEAKGDPGSGHARG
ncbi:MAG TPA: hypothetical protein VNN08_02340 [Thermoanaerobaculia bacterium]|nr:hypothetical protein [Thermoanaerobaculia bacterium]